MRVQAFLKSRSATKAARAEISKLEAEAKEESKLAKIKMSMVSLAASFLRRAVADEMRRRARLGWRETSCRGIDGERDGGFR